VIEAIWLKISEGALEARARRAARRIGLVARKSRWRWGSIDNYGGFQILNPFTNFILEGVRFNLSAQDVIDYCREETS
jgi:hypothetical protein